MANASQQDYHFNFKFNLHKSLIPIGIDDSDYIRLQTVYGVDGEWMRETVTEFTQSNTHYAQLLKEEVDLSILGSKPLKIAFFGDSITSDRQSYLNILKLATKEYQNISLVDMAISAHKSVDLLTAIYPNMVGEHADIAHIMIGTNDLRRIDDERCLYHTSPAEYEKNVDYVVSALVKDGTKVILTTIPPFSKEKSSKAFAEAKALFLEQDRQIFNAIIMKIAKKYGAYINHMDSSYAQYTPEQLTLDDGIHINEIGQDLLLRGVVNSILELI